MTEADALWILQCALDEWGGLVGKGAAQTGGTR